MDSRFSEVTEALKIYFDGLYHRSNVLLGTCALNAGCTRRFD